MRPPKKLKGLIVYNGSLRYGKIDALVSRMVESAPNHNIELLAIKNSEFLISQERDSSLEVRITKQLGSFAISSKERDELESTYAEPISLHSNPSNPCIKLDESIDFVLFWDKDVRLARFLENHGYLVLNSARAIEVCDDKMLMHEILAGSGIKLPKTIFAPFVYYDQKLSEGYIQEVFERLGEPLVLKTAKGSFGMGVSLEDKQTIKGTITSLLDKPFLFQEMVKTSFGRDIRVNIVGEKIVGAMERRSSGDFRANITLGAEGRPVNLSEEQKQIALAAHKSLGLDFSGVDILFGEDDKPILCEVNSNVNFLSFEKVTGIDFASEIFSYIRYRTESRSKP